MRTTKPPSPGGFLFIRCVKELLAQELLTSWLDQHERFADMKENLGSIAVFTYFCGLLVAGLFQGF
jgi:hypothetical protein